MKIVLTSHELEILKQASAGKSTDLIASETGRNKNEVDKDLKSVCVKLKNKNPLDAMQALLKSDFEVIG